MSRYRSLSRWTIVTILGLLAAMAPWSPASANVLQCGAVLTTNAITLLVLGWYLLSGRALVRPSAFRPRFAIDPYATGIPGVYICSAATPPGGEEVADRCFH